MIDIILHSALFGLTLTFGVYILMSAVNQRTGSPLLNPVSRHPHHRGGAAGV